MNTELNLNGLQLMAGSVLGDVNHLFWVIDEPKIDSNFLDF